MDWGGLSASIEKSDEDVGQKKIEADVILLTGTSKACTIKIKKDKADRTELEDPSIYISQFSPLGFKAGNACCFCLRHCISGIDVSFNFT